MPLPIPNHSATGAIDGTPETPADGQPRQLRPRVRKVILRVSQPSAPDAPAATPVLPPPEDHSPQTPLLPLPPPPHLPPLGTGLPNPVDGQYSLASPSLAMNAPPTYAHPYGATFYPPPYPPTPHYSPYGASISAAPFPPWGYAQYPMAPLPGPPLGHFLTHPLATQRATTSDEDSPAYNVRGHTEGPMDQDIPPRGDTGPTGTHGNAGTNVAAPTLTTGTRSGRTYPNREVSNGGKRHVPLRWEVGC